MSNSFLKIFAAASFVALLATGAQAQGVGGTDGMGDGSGFGGGHRQQDHAKKQPDPPKPKADDKAYNSALKQLPDKKYDAWHDVR